MKDTVERFNSAVIYRIRHLQFSGSTFFLPRAAGIIFFLFLFHPSLFGQKNYTIRIVEVDSVSSVNKKVSGDFSKKPYRTIEEARKGIDAYLLDLRSEGFLAAGIDSIVTDSLVTTAYIYTGQKYDWATLRIGNVPDVMLDGTGFNKKNYSTKPFRYDRVAALQSSIIKNCENNGYPFASIKLDTIEIVDSHISAALSLSLNKLIQIDSVIVKGTSTIAPVYLYNYIGIKPGDIYNESQIRKITSRMHELPFVKEVRSSQILFSEDATKLYLYLENKKASQFDGVIGLLPDENKQGKFHVTGEVHLKLQNSLKRGEVIELNWKQLPVQTQDLKIHALYPFIFSTPFGIDGLLSIYKKDSTYVDVIKNIGVQYALTGNNFLKAFINDKQSDLQSVEGMENITTLPPYADITIVSYGLTLHFEKLDYRFNPRKGFALEATGSTGNRTIRRNSKINPAVYEGLNLTSVTYMGELAFDFYFSPGGRHVFDIGSMAAYIYNPDLFVNELYRIGGLKSLRGFDEESIYASLYAIGKIEYRYQLEQNSFLFTFFNIAGYRNESRNSNIRDTPYGFGAGINFETRLGVMSVSYALGKQFENPILVRNGKIHFGIVNYF